MKCNIFIIAILCRLLYWSFFAVLLRWINSGKSKCTLCANFVFLCLLYYNTFVPKIINFTLQFTNNRSLLSTVFYRIKFCFVVAKLCVILSSTHWSESPKSAWSSGVALHFVWLLANDWVKFHAVKRYKQKVLSAKTLPQTS